MSKHTKGPWVVPSAVQVGGQATYQDLILGIDLKERRIKDRAKLWDFYQSEAIKVKPRDYCRRMVMAECAIRAIAIIKKGKRAISANDMTLARFSKDIGIDRRTLGDWCKAKLNCFDKIPAESQIGFNVTAAISAVEAATRLKRIADDNYILTKYAQFVKNPKSRRARDHYYNYLLSVQRALNIKNPDNFDEHSLDVYAGLASKILHRINEIKKIRGMQERTTEGKGE